MATVHINLQGNKGTSKGNRRLSGDGSSILKLLLLNICSMVITKFTVSNNDPTRILQCLSFEHANSKKSQEKYSLFAFMNSFLLTLKTMMSSYSCLLIHLCYWQLLSPLFFQVAHMSHLTNSSVLPTTLVVEEWRGSSADVSSAHIVCIRVDYDWEGTLFLDSIYMSFAQNQVPLMRV